MKNVTNHKAVEGDHSEALQMGRIQAGALVEGEEP